MGSIAKVETCEAIVVVVVVAAVIDSEALTSLIPR